MKYVRVAGHVDLCLAHVGESEKFISHPARGHSCPGLMLVYAIV